MPRWPSYFDRIYCIHHLPDKGRMPSLESELRRVGILDSGIFQFVFTTPDPWESRLLEKCPEIAGTRERSSSIGFLNLGLASARTLREALCIGYRRVLFLEDDIRFLKDLDALDAALAATPDGFDIVQYDKFVDWNLTPEQYRDMAEALSVSPLYFDARGKDYYSSGCFMATRRGMENMLRAMDEWRPAPMDAYMNMNGSTHAVAKRNLAVQIVYGDAMLWNYLQREKANTHHKAYAPQGVRYEDYAVPEGYGYAALTATA
jgi:hypothetical protein